MLSEAEAGGWESSVEGDLEGVQSGLPPQCPAFASLPGGARAHEGHGDALEGGLHSLARWLGHSDPGFTLRKYAHFLPRAGACGSTAIDAVFA
ncbi:hypothetical protein [Streptomyces noursei]|uniref:hypothetical protein n=1 Tax=Streptomyces noursei TaxID=1971 RepID=UPI00167AAF69|nr:hypothetical protein [Streptomyces noursei]